MPFLAIVKSPIFVEKVIIQPFISMNAFIIKNAGSNLDQRVVFRYRCISVKLHEHLSGKSEGNTIALGIIQTAECGSFRQDLGCAGKKFGCASVQL